MTTVHDVQDFICGDTWELTGPLQDADGNALVLSGAAISWKLDSVDGATNYLSLSLGSGIAILDAPTSTILVTVTKEQSAALSAGIYRDWLRVTLADGTRVTEWTGIIRASTNPA